MVTSYNLTPNQIASWFICSIDREAGDAITHLKLQKLLYYAQAWSMVFDGKSLFVEDFEAWAHGPVLRSIYDLYKDYGYDSIPPKIQDDIAIPEDAEATLKEVYRVYGEKSAKALENLTHSEAPWIEARKGYEPQERCSVVITKESMLECYKEMLDNG